MDRWGAERIEDLAAFVAEAMPDEDLTADEILTACYEQPGVVLGAADSTGVVAVGVGREPGGALVAVVRLLVVAHDAPGANTALALLRAAETWSSQRGVERVLLGGGLPFLLWPGVEPGGHLEAWALAAGFHPVGDATAHEVDVSFRSEPPDDVEVRRVVRDADVTAVTLAVAAAAPASSDEVARAVDHGTCHGAFARRPATDPGAPSPDDVLGIGCHSVTRAGWVGPLGVRPEQRRRGIGRSLLGQICRDLMIAEFPAAVVPDVDEVGSAAFVRSSGGRPTRVFRRMAKRLDPLAAEPS